MLVAHEEARNFYRKKLETTIDSNIGSWFQDYMVSKIAGLFNLHYNCFTEYLERHTGVTFTEAPGFRTR